MIDLTTLEGADTPGKVRRSARRPCSPTRATRRCRRSPPCASTRRSSRRASPARRPPVRVASVATAFPSGQAPLATRIAEVGAAVADGADEIDMVIDRGAFLSGRFGEVADEIEQVKEACRAAHLKVILETGELGTYDDVRQASLLAMAPAPTSSRPRRARSARGDAPDHPVMLEAIRDYFVETGRVVGMKPAGGIRDASRRSVPVLVKETLGTRGSRPSGSGSARPRS